MGDVETVPSAGTEIAASVEAPPTPSGPDYSKSDSELADQILSEPGESTAAGEPAGGEPEPAEAPPVEAEPVAAAPAEPPEKVEAKADDGKLPEEEVWGEGTPLETLSPAEKTFLKAHPPLRDSVYRDRVMTELGMTVKEAAALRDLGVTSVEDVTQALESTRALQELEGDFLTKTPEGAANLIHKLSQVDGEAAANLVRAAAKLQKVADPQGYADRQIEAFDTLMANLKARWQGNEEALQQIAEFNRLAESAPDLPTSGREKPLPTEKEKRLAELEAKESERSTSGDREFRSGTNAAASKAVSDLVAAQVLKLIPEGAIHPTLRPDILKKAKSTIDDLIRTPVFRARYNAHLSDTSKTPEERRAAAVAEVLSRAEKLAPRLVRQMTTPYTRQTVKNSEDRQAKVKAAVARRDIGSAGTPAMPKPAPLNFTNMSDDQIADAILAKR